MSKQHRKFSRNIARKIMAGVLRGRIRTRDGHPVRIVAWDACGEYPIVGLIYISCLDAEMSWQWTRQGVAFGHMDSGSVNFDLVIEINNKSTVSRLRRGPNKKKRK